ncbi:MAG: hypothetical protein ING36_14575 [Burkholderiales bacterium]|jgi:hypothetical protein|nr:hypothetical protein [Burkholderiales bacterium]
MNNERKKWVGVVWLFLATSLLSTAKAQETVCARVKIEIKQELTLERQAFDAEMRINNTTDTGVIENVSIEVKITDEAGTPILATDNPNDLSAKFFVRLSNKQNIAAIDGTGTVNPKTTSTINWLIIPAPGSAGINPAGKKYLVGATLKYKFGGEETVLNVTPDVITVKPLPLLTLDYFLTQDVWADDPLTSGIEPTEPFTLGVRVKNTGFATAKNLKIDSAQPKIIENNQGLLINFLLTGSYVNDTPVQNSLLINFGDIAPGTSKMGRWNMETTLAGKFTEFTARFSHADELGGALTSILQATNAHFLIRDVRVDLPGRDYVRDFLARYGDVIRVYESDGPDTEVTDRSNVASLNAGVGTNGNASFQLSFPPTAGFVFVRLPDPFNGSKALGKIVRSDAKELLPENVWLSKTRNEQTKLWEHWVNFFDVNSTGQYQSEFQAPPPVAQAPVIQFIPERVVKEGKQVSFLVEASSPDGRAVNLSAAPMPAGATFTLQAPDAGAVGLRRAIFDWTPAKGSAGTYLITYTANDGLLSATRSATIKVEADTPPPGPATPTIDMPLSGAQVTSLRPTLSVQTSTNTQDPTTQVQFEVYADEAETQQVATVTVPKAASAPGNGAGPVALPTQWQLPTDLSDNTRYWWRARAFDGILYSPWANGWFFVNTFNDAPDTFNLTNPIPGAEVASSTPSLSWTNSVDKDGDVLTYSVLVYKNAALTELVAEVHGLPQDPSGITSWVVTVPLINHATYYWRVVAKDALGAQTPTPARPFVVNTGNTAPTVPVVLSPAVGGQSTSLNTVLSIQNSTDAENDLISYIFEIDTVNTFDSADKRNSGLVVQSGSSTTTWTTPLLVENRRYWWRVKAQDGRAESVWVVADFLMNATNESPPAPTVKNPGNGAWTATQQPTLEANPVLDPEGDLVRYEFEVYRNAGLTQKVVEGVSTNAGWIVSAPLADKTTHWWRVRAVDANNAVSAWSQPTVLYLSTAPYQDPTIALTSPAVPVMPDAVNTPLGLRKQVVLRWEGTDPNIEPTVALYWGTTNSGFTGNIIVDGLRQAAGTQSGSYVWDVTDLSPGTYYVYVVIYNAKGVGKAYAPGAVVIPSVQQTGSVMVTAGNNLRTSEDGRTAAFNIRLGRAPRANVVVPLSTTDAREGTVSPASLTFTPQNWAVNQAVTITGQNDCAPDGNKTYQVISGKAQSTDPDYIGLSGRPVNVVNLDNADFASTTNNPNLHICGLSVVSERRVNARTWEYTLRAELTNLGNAIAGLNARLERLPLGMRAVENILTFGAVGQGENAKTNDTVIVRSRFQVPANFFRLGRGFRWNVTVLP